MSEHTPGPWFVHNLPNHEQTGRMWPISANNDPGSALAYVGLQNQPNLANARLMAAAPELLDCARFFEEMLAVLNGESEHGEDGGLLVGDADTPAMLARVRAAIAKAEGKP